MNALKGIFTPKRPEEIELDDTSFRRRTIAVLILLVIMQQVIQARTITCGIEMFS